MAGEQEVEDRVLEVDATEVRELEIGGRRAFEGAIATSISRGFMQAVDLERGGCTIVAEYPPALAASYEQQARAFLDSVALGEFNG